MSGPRGIWSMFSWWHRGCYFFLTLKPWSMRFDYNHCPIAELHRIYEYWEHGRKFPFLYRRPAGWGDPHSGFKCTHRHTQLSLPHPQARQAQLIHLKVCKNLFLSWMNSSGIHSVLCSAKLRGKFLNHILFLFPKVKPLQLLHMRHGFPITSHLSFVKDFSQSLYYLWLSSQGWCSVGTLPAGLCVGQVCPLTYRPPSSWRDLPFLTAPWFVFLICPFLLLGPANFQHILLHRKCVEICFPNNCIFLL